MELNIRIISSNKVLFSNILSRPLTIAIYLKKKKMLHQLLLFVLFCVILIIFISSIVLLIKMNFCNRSINENAYHLKTQINRVMELNTSIDIFRTQISEITEQVKLLEYNMTTSYYIDPIMTNEIKHLRNKVSPWYHHFLSLANLSTIIEGVDELITIFQWMPLIEKTPIEHIRISLLYKGSRDGDDKEVFHMHCDDQSPFLILIKAKANFTNPQTHQTKEVFVRIGGISNAKLQSNRQLIKVIDESLVLFSLDNTSKYKVDRSYSGLYTGSEMIINFGFVIYLVDNWKHDANKLYLSHPYKNESAYLYQDNPWPYQDSYYTVEEVEFFNIQTHFGIN